MYFVMARSASAIYRPPPSMRSISTQPRLSVFSEPTVQVAGNSVHPMLRTVHGASAEVQRARLAGLVASDGAVRTALPSASHSVSSHAHALRGRRMRPRRTSECHLATCVWLRSQVWQQREVGVALRFSLSLRLSEVCEACLLVVCSRSGGHSGTLLRLWA
jgi:hypothetical protein